MAYEGIKGTVNGLRNTLDDLETLADDLWKQHIKDQHATESAYREGLHDAWEAAREVVVNTGAGGLPYDELDEIFGTHNCDTIFRENLASEAIEKIKAYKEKAYELNVGDEIVTDHPKDGSDLFGVAVEVNEDTAKVLMEDFTFWFPRKGISTYRKTGRHVPVDRIFEGSR